MTVLRKIGSAVLSAVLTNQCEYCGRVISSGTRCDECEGAYPLITGEKCRYCGAAKKRCTCKNHKMRYDGITAPFYYEDCAKTALLRLKFGKKDYTAYTLARDMASAVRGDFKDIEFDFITFVPFSRRQTIERPYNQSELLAVHLGKRLNLPVYSVMTKLFDTGVQHSLGNRRRSGNVAGVYDIKRGADVSGKTVLLVDDIKTTGATLNECAKIMKIRGAESVYCVAAAVAAEKEKGDKTEKPSVNKEKGE